MTGHGRAYLPSGRLSLLPARGWGPLSPTRGPNWRLHRLRSGRVTETTTLCSPRSIPDKGVAIYSGLRNLGQCHACRLYEVVFEKLHMQLYIATALHSAPSVPWRSATGVQHVPHRLRSASRLPLAIWLPRRSLSEPEEGSGCSLNLFWLGDQDRDPLDWRVASIPLRLVVS